MRDNFSMAQKPASELHDPYFFKEWRKARGFTQEALASKIAELRPGNGMTASSISQLENGQQGFTGTTLKALAEALDCHPGELLMRNPFDDEDLWSLWDRENKALAEAFLRAVKAPPDLQDKILSYAAFELNRYETAREMATRPAM